MNKNKRLAVEGTPDMKISLEKLTSSELIDAYSGIIKELKKREIIRTDNVAGDLGEYLAI